MEIAEVGNAIGDTRVAQAQGRRITAGNRLVGDEDVVLAHDPRKYADGISPKTTACRAESARCIAGIFYGLPTHLQEQPLLGIHRLRLSRRDPKEFRIETVDLVDEPAAVRDRFAGG